jgi:hypothetical protein
MSEADSGFELAVEVSRKAAERGLPLRLLGGQAVRLLCPEFEPRRKKGQDLDFASVRSARKQVAEFLTAEGFQPEVRFNTLHGDRQMLFGTPDGSAAVDVIIDQLQMCHVLVFKNRLDRMPYTLDVTDLLMSKLQVVEQNSKDVHDIVYLLAAYPVRSGDEPGTIGLDRFGQIVAGDWGWWRTVTRNLERTVELATGEFADFVPADAPYDPLQQAQQLRRYADSVPKSMKWKVRSRIGERVQWYELPEEAH